MEPPARPAAAAKRMVSATVSGACPKPFSRSAATGQALTDTMSPAWVSASSRVTSPSSLPSVAAHAALEVASASNPSACMMAAEPPSQTLGMTKGPAP